MQLPSLILAALLTSSHAAEPLPVTIDPPSPAPGKAFRYTALVPGLACGKIRESALSLPEKWMLVSQTLVNKGEDCLVVKVLVAAEGGRINLPGLKVSAVDGRQFNFASPSVAVGEASGAAPSSAAAGPDLDQFIAQIRNFLAAYVLGAEVPSGSGFSIESCREPVQNLLMVMMGLKPSVERQLKFQTGCDVQGRSEFKLNKPIPLDFEVRNLGMINRFKAVVTVTLGNGAGLDRIISTQVDDGQAFSEGRPFVRFSMTHARTVTPDLQRFSLVDRKNEGKVRITEFRGQATDRVVPFVEQRFLVEQKK